MAKSGKMLKNYWALLHISTNLSRTFLVKSIKIIKANAILNGRDEADLSDLKALKFLLAFRVPEEVLQLAEEKLESIQNQKKKTKK